MEKELLEAVLLDIKKLVKENPNDMDLGKKVRTYFLGLPNIIEEFKNQLDDKKI
jgi:hypothetical protein